jgi:hypothetical protein
MSTLITCPNCKAEFSSKDAIAKTLEKEYEERLNNQRSQMMKEVSLQQQQLDNQRREFEEKKKKENEIFAEKLQREKLKLEAELQEQLRKSISGDYENKIRLLQQANTDNDEKLRNARQKELEFLQKEQALKNKEAELEIQLHKRLNEERANIAEQIKKQEIEKNSLKDTEFQMKLKEMEKQLEDQKKLTEEMRRKQEQGSMQLQGEVQELALENILREKFPFDVVQEVGKGVEGADCIQTVRSTTGKECGKIIYESKRAKGWNNVWLDKLKSDKRSKGAEEAILVTKSFPKGMDRFGQREGIWICSYAEVASVAAVLRNAIMCVSDAKFSQENKGEKMQMLYDYMASNGFRQKWDSIVETYLTMQKQLSEEKLKTQRNWSQRERQLDIILKNAVGFIEDVNIIGGLEINSTKLLNDVADFNDDMAH